MLVDAKTVRDLDLYGTRDRREGIFQTLDMTRTPGGRAALRFRFEHPLTEPDSIRQVQSGVRFLASQEIEFQLDTQLIAEVRQYLDSLWDVASRAHGLRFFLESTLVALRYRDLLNQARFGVAATVRLAADVQTFLNHISERGPPQEVREPVEDLKSLIGDLRLGDLPTSPRPWAVFRADRYLRRDRKDELQAFFDLLSELDALMAMAVALEEKNLVLPEVVDGPEFVLEGEGVFHLFVDRAVGNPVKMRGGENLVFLTGPNMAGKTTYLKAVAVAAYLAHLGMGVPAKHLRIAPLDAVFSSLAPEENLREGLSYFMAEVRRVREVAEFVAGGGRTLVVFDEVFRGTNVRDALEASRLVILGFAKSRSSGFIFASHLVELAEDLKDGPAIGFSYFDGQIREGQAQYGFLLKDGVSRQRFGIHLLEQEGVLEILRDLRV